MSIDIWRLIYPGHCPLVHCSCVGCTDSTRFVWHLIRVRFEQDAFLSDVNIAIGHAPFLSGSSYFGSRHCKVINYPILCLVFCS